MRNEHAYPHDFGMEPCKGLTKREYMAAMIMSGMQANPFWDAFNWKEVAESAVKAADALLEELEP